MNDFTPAENDIADAMRALGHPVRLNILNILAEKCNAQCCCTDVTKCLPLAQSTVSQHIKVLLEAGLIDRQAKGTRNCYTVNYDRLETLQHAYGTYLKSLSQNLAQGCNSAPSESSTKQ